MIVTNAFDELKWRGLVYDHTESVPDLLRDEKITFYNGFDPSANSLHVGHLVPMMGLARLQRFGHTPIAVAGGGTGMIGDPSGRSEERNLLSPTELEANLAGIRQQLATILDFEVKSNPAIIVNNADWLANVSMMAFLRDVGKHFTVNYMLAKDSVKARIDREGAGISFTEFSYMLLQAYDFLVLHDRYGCVLQAGGSDQWGNVLSGVELIRRVRGSKAHALAYPLITRADGSKFGKTAAGAIWLDPRRTSPYRFYQFWLNTDDANVVNYLKFFTWLDHRAILELEQALLNRPEQRDAQRTLAREVTQMVHGPTALAKAEQASEVLFGGDISGLDADDIADIFADVPSSDLARPAFADGSVPLVDLLVNSNLASSKGAARRDIQGGGIYLNNVRVAEADRQVTLADSVAGQFLVLRKGRKKYHLVRLS
ncbi:MAG: tyrosine--tRNA ligase [Anaerolineales bacterium]|nr:tyrosine--tRNA ligase [Anaerolineales bacterium]